MYAEANFKKLKITTLEDFRKLSRKRLLWSVTSLILHSVVGVYPDIFRKSLENFFCGKTIRDGFCVPVRWFLLAYY